MDLDCPIFSSRNFSTWKLHLKFPVFPTPSLAEISGRKIGQSKSMENKTNNQIRKRRKITGKNQINIKEGTE